MCYLTFKWKWTGEWEGLSARSNSVDLLPPPLLPSSPPPPPPTEDAGQRDWSWALTPHRRSGRDHPESHITLWDPIFFSLLLPRFFFLPTSLLPNPVDPCQHDGSRTCTFGIILFSFILFFSFIFIFIFFCQWWSATNVHSHGAVAEVSFRVIPGFPQRDGYKWVRGAETFCCWDFRWVRLHYTISSICICERLKPSPPPHNSPEHWWMVLLQAEMSQRMKALLCAFSLAPLCPPVPFLIF